MQIYGKNQSRWMLIFLMLALFAGMLISLYLLSNATENSASIGPYYSWLLVGNAIGLITLATILGHQLYHLFLEYRQRRAGIRLTLRMVVMFVILAVVPASLVYVLSIQFLQRGIDSWFDVRIEAALGDALDLSRDAMAGRIREKARITLAMAESLADTPTSLATLDMVDLRLSGSADEIALLDTAGRVYAFSNIDPEVVVPYAPSELVYSQLRQGYPYLDMEPIEDRGFFIRVVIAIPDTASVITGEKRLIQALYPVAERLNTLAQSVQSAFGAYKELSYIRDELKQSFILTLSLAFALNILTAVVVAVLSARRMVEPIRILLDGTRALSRGEYDKQLAVTSQDELGQLVGSFNDMTLKIAEASQQARLGQIAAEEERTYVQTVLSRLTSGLITFNNRRRIVTMNPMASRILFNSEHDMAGQSLDEVIDSYPYLQELYNCLSRNMGSGKHEWQEELTILNQHGRQVLIINGTLLSQEPGHEGEHIVMFDDVTEFVQAQRNAAWEEMARRLAHEIKNPLTPIQLSAERVRHKCLQEISGRPAEVLDRSTRTIIDQVEAMKGMVNAFTQYARNPELKMIPLSPNKLISEIINMYEGDRLFPQVRLELTRDAHTIIADQDRLRQLLHNLIKNSIDAMEQTSQPMLRVTTKLFGDVDICSLQMTVQDNGPGFDRSVINNIFEPYVTTKDHGTGLGMAIVKKIVEEHNGTISVSNVAEGGARITITLPCQAKHKT